MRGKSGLARRKMAFLSSTATDSKNSPHDAQKKNDRSSGNRGGFYQGSMQHWCIACFMKPFRIGFWGWKPWIQTCSSYGLLFRIHNRIRFAGGHLKTLQLKLIPSRAILLIQKQPQVPRTNHIFFPMFTLISRSFFSRTGVMHKYRHERKNLK